MRLRIGFLAAAALFFGPAAHPAAAQSGFFSEWNETAGARRPAAACAALRALTGYDFSIETAVVVPAQGDVPEHCLVQGLIQPEVRFEVGLPTAWNGRLYMFGNGGFAGESLLAGGRVNMRTNAIRRGFATAQTNTGHEAAREPLATFASTPQKLVDDAFRAVHVTAVTAKSLVQAYYREPAARSYFVGCSTGGRQGLMAAQRFPDDFDGIVVGAPVLDFTGVMTQAAVMHRALTAAPVTFQHVQVVADRVLAKCDALDGVKDGLIEDPRRCRFDVEKDVPACATTGSDSGCLPQAQAQALKAVYADVTSRGGVVFPGFPVGGEASVPTAGGPRTGWAPWIVSDANTPTISLQFAESFFKEMVTPGSPLDWRQFDPDADMEKLARIGGLLNATDPDLTPFKARGGKILMYFGWADPALNPLMGINYYERMRQATAGADDFFRLFMMPGVLHCSGGNGPSEFDAVTALVEWVEAGRAPERLPATQRVGGKPVRTRPLCRYPTVARYDGKGDPNAASSFTCGPAD